jgi:hypothetical protein
MHNTRIVYANPSALQLVKCAGDSTSVEGMLATDLMPKLADHFRVLPFSNDAANVAAHKWTGRTEITCLDGSLTLVDVDLSAMGPVDRHDEGSLTICFNSTKASANPRGSIKFPDRPWYYCCVRERH